MNTSLRSVQAVRRTESSIGVTEACLHIKFQEINWYQKENPAALQQQEFS